MAPWNEETANAIFENRDLFFFAFRNSNEKADVDKVKILEPLAAKHRPKLHPAIEQP